ncbi:MAG: hypothetical protein LN413_04140, partial [Candidatus Thermoplasmatota archaeon]|nr:hypothetical protein [Candidatus Thermoplasmatota archaeon]
EYTDTREIRLVGVGSESLSALTKTGLTAFADGEDVVVQTTATEDLSTVFGHISQAGLAFRDVITERPSLEDVFLALVGARIEEGELKP